METFIGEFLEFHRNSRENAEPNHGRRFKVLSKEINGRFIKKNPILIFRVISRKLWKQF